MTPADLDSPRLLPVTGNLWTVVAGVAGAAASSVLGLALWCTSQRVPGPDGSSWHDLDAWLQREPVSASFRLLAMVGTAITAYLSIGSLASALAALARMIGCASLATTIEVLTVPVVRRTLAGLVSLGAALVADHSPAGARATVAVSVAEPSDAEPGTEAGTAVLEPLDRAPAATPTETADRPDQWTVQPGDHLWGLARAALLEAGRSTSDAAVADYLEAVVELNRSRLVVQDEPDLIFPGQVFVRPPLPPRTSTQA